VLFNYFNLIISKFKNIFKKAFENHFPKDHEHSKEAYGLAFAFKGLLVKMAHITRHPQLQRSVKLRAKN